MSHPQRLPLSAVIITRNAASSLPDCLKALAFCDEILVVDSGSTDQTVALAVEHGAKIVHQDWLGFGAQKQFAATQAAHDWVLCVDADERVSETLKESILRALAQPHCLAYRFPRRNRFLGRYLHHGEGYPDWSLRLFDRRHARWSTDTVHEKVLTQTQIGSLNGDLLHDSAESLSTYLDKQNRYTTLAAQQAHAAGERSHVGHLVLSPLLRFLKLYFLRLGFLDGVPGLAHILIGCGNSFVKHAKIIELQSRSSPT
ncbi:MAG: glycosyltransferase family 2 protein [Betaproteobacteria bacterium]|nr:glycosyltransferase family 2 protein [Betaproteobacteria bacterium]